MRQVDMIFNSMLGKGKPSPYIDCDYLESDGKGRYIDTGVCVGGQSSIEIDNFSSSESLSSAEGIWICGARNGAKNSEYNFRYSGSALAVRFGNAEYRTNPYTTGARYNYSRHKNVVLITNQGGGTFYNRTFGNQTTTPKYTFYLFDMNNAGMISALPFSLRIGNVRIYDDNDVLVRDFRPAVRNADGVAGMYDVVNDVFYTNANPAGDNFLYGNLT